MPTPRSAPSTTSARHLPLLQALAANSPFRHGRDTGLASAREVTLRAWPRSGLPRALRDFDDFCAMADRLARAADVEDYTWFWWKLRPHPRLGTVEVRALDVQGSLQDTAAIVALTHCLARSAVEQTPHDVAPELLEEGIFRAARFGTAARLPDADGALRPVSELHRHSARALPALTPTSSDAPTSSSSCPSCSDARAAPDASAASTAWPAWTRCCVS